MKGRIAAIALVLGAPGVFARTPSESMQAAVPLPIAAETARPTVTPPPVNISAVSASSNQPVLLALTPVRIEILATINSRTNKKGETFPIRLADAVPLPDGSQVPAGITGSGEIVHAAKSGFGGRPGELILAARYLEWNGTRIPLRSLTLQEPGRGHDQSGAASALSIAGGAAGTLIAFMISGGEVNVPAGTIAFAKTSASTAFPPTPPPPLTPADSERLSSARLQQPLSSSSKQEGSLKP